MQAVQKYKIKIRAIVFFFLSKRNLLRKKAAIIVYQTTPGGLQTQVQSL